MESKMKEKFRQLDYPGLEGIQPVPHIFEMPTLSGAQNIDAIKIVSLICDTN